MALTLDLGRGGARRGSDLPRPTMRPRAAVFVDKDGTLVEDVPYNVDPTRVRFTRRALEGLRILDACGYPIIVVSNQPGLALGRFDEAALRALAHALAGQLAAAGVRLTAFEACPHHPRGTVHPWGLSCICRKPAPGMLWKAARTHRLALERSWMIGDILDDVEAGRRAGCRTILLDVGHETVWKPGPLRVPHHRARDLLDAAHRIVLVDQGETPADLARRRTKPPEGPDAPEANGR